MKSLTYIEVDLPVCSLTYGQGACLAVLGLTGEIKCFNTARTCQDRVNFATETVTMRFAVDTAYLPQDIEAIPNVVGVEFDGASISLGQDLGIRATLSVTFRDHRHSDTGEGGDPYRGERGYDPFDRGTFWGKFRARQPYLRGKPIRLIRGLLGETLEQMERRHYVIEHFDGPHPDGSYRIIAKDVLKFADNDRAQAPRVSTGRLTVDIDEVATEFTITPAGTGNLEYPASGFVSLGGKEMVGFTRSGDDFTVVRAQKNTEAQAHKADDRVQLALEFNGQDPATIIQTLLVTYANVPAEYIPFTDWLTEVTTHLQRVYTACIAQPVGVNELISELVEQAALAVWWDDIAQLLRLQVLREVLSTASTFNEDNVVEGTLDVLEQPELRVSEVWTYFGQRNPLEPLDQDDNYRTVHVTTDPQAESDYGTPAIKKIRSRWIPDFGRTTAARVNAIQLARFRDPPRGFKFDIYRSSLEGNDVALGGGYQFGNWSLQDETGARVLVPVQVTYLRPGPDRYIVGAEEILFTGVDVTDDANIRTIIIDTNSYGVDLKTVHDSLFPEITDPSGLVVNCVVSSGVLVGSNVLGRPALSIEGFPAGLVINLTVNGRIQGRGGAGGAGGTGTNAFAEAGSTALYLRNAVNLTNKGEIWGGGGGGGGKTATINGAGGGGGQGYAGGAKGSSFSGGAITAPTDGTPGAPGAAGSVGGSASGAGGGPGLPGGSNATTYGGGVGGSAVDGVSHLTVLEVGDIQGAQIN